MFKRVPWKYLLRRLARTHRFIDPVNLMTVLEKFSQPSEIREPIELLRAGAAFHARGLMNTKAIQHNLDWIWPYWVQRQFDPKDKSFIPRAFSITHVNLTHRNWTAVGIPGCNALPIVDPRGMITPFFDGWSLDGWIIGESGITLIPSQLETVSQSLLWNTNDLTLRTKSVKGSFTLINDVSVKFDDNNQPVCSVHFKASADKTAWLVIALRPYNPEGVSLINTINLIENRRAWTINGIRSVTFPVPIERSVVSDYRKGDVFSNILSRQEAENIDCEAGMATAVAMYRIEPGNEREVTADVHLSGDSISQPLFPNGSNQMSWAAALEDTAKLKLSYDRYQFLYESALRTLILHAPGDVYPGPYTYKRFWFRDACFIVHAMLCTGQIKLARRIMHKFSNRQNRNGYFHSQEGEWDSNGQVLWLFDRYIKLTGNNPVSEWENLIIKGANWIIKKRCNDNIDAIHKGLMPAGFSAEHLGPNDYFYWDNFWSVAGLQAAANMMKLYGRSNDANRYALYADKLLTAVNRSLEHPLNPGIVGIPASPYRRMDAGAIGSIAAGYPLHLYSPEDEKLQDTIKFLCDNCLVDNAFFQDMTHSGLNAYLTLHIAQVMLRSGDNSWDKLVQSVADLASPTGQWPEAIHPITLGGCMGDGQHVWAAAEWLMMIRNFFVREEEDRLIIASGILKEWYSECDEISFGPTPTQFGVVEVTIKNYGLKIQVSWKFLTRINNALMEIRLPGYKSVIVDDLKIDTIKFDVN